jgi:hypothetical protein
MAVIFWVVVGIIVRAVIAAGLAALAGWLLAKYTKRSAPVIDWVRLSVLLIVWALLALLAA